LKADQRDHDLRQDLDAFLLHLRRGLEHRARLHRRDLGIADAEAAAAEAEHRVELVQLLDALVDARRRHADLLRQLLLLLLRVRQELVQRRVQEADRRRVALQRAEDAGEVLALVRQQLRQRGLPGVLGLGQDHLPHRVDAVPSKNMCSGAGEADADRAERDGIGRLLRRVGVGADAHPRRVEHHFISCWKCLNFSVCCAVLSSVDQAGDDLGRRGLHLAGVDLARCAVDRHPVAFLERLALDLHRPRLVVHFDAAAPQTQTLPICRRHERGVRRDAAAGGEDAFAAIMPRRSSGDVSTRTSRTFCPFSAAPTARSAFR
jgi:hypothetical protein